MAKKDKNIKAIIDLRKTFEDILPHIPANIRTQYIKKLNTGFKEIETCQNLLNIQLDELSKTRDELAKSEKKYRILIETANDTIFIINADTGIIQDVNKKAEELIKTKAENIIGKHRDVFHQAKKTFQDYVSDLRGKSLMTETGITDIHGKQIPVELSANIIDVQNGSDILLELYRDITDRKTADEAIKKSEQKFRSIFNNSADAIFIHEPGGHFIEVNNISVEHLGYTKEEFLQMSPEDVDTPEEAVKVRERTEKVQEQGQFIFETKHQAKDGTIIPVEVNSSIIEFLGKKAVMSIVRDTTERKEAERALHESEEKYRLLVEEHQMLFGQWI